MHWKNNVIDYKIFLSSFKVKPNGKMAFLIGSGASIQAGIPSGGMLLWEFKKEIFCRETKTRREMFSNMEMHSNKTKIQAYFDTREEYPSLHSPDEYSFYFEKYLPAAIDRQHYIQRIVKDVSPTIGHKCLGSLFINEKIDCVFTTNFDELIESGIKEVFSGKSFEVISSINKDNLCRITSPYPKVIKLHGDFRYDKLQNTISETQRIEDELLTHFTVKSKDVGMVVVGYSGSDESVMNTLEITVNNNKNFPNGLIWVIKKGIQPNERVISLIDKSRRNNELSAFLEVDSIDEFLYSLYSECDFKDENIENIAKCTFEKRKQYSAPQASNSMSLIKINAFEIEQYPTSAYCFDAEIDSWKELREIISGKNIIASLNRGKVLAFADAEQIKSVFSFRLKSELKIVDLEPSHLNQDNSFYIGMLYEYISFQIQNIIGLQQTKRDKQKFYIEGKIIESNRTYRAYEAFEYQLQFLNNKLWFVIMPSVYVEEIVPGVDKMFIANRIKSTRYNKNVDETLKMWRDVFALKAGSNNWLINFFGFDMEIKLVFSYGGAKVTSNAYFFERMFLVKEPELSFCVVDSAARCIHPLKGLYNYGPLDVSFKPEDRLNENLQLAIISPKNHFEKLIKHLNGLKEISSPKSEKDYLIEYPGFERIYRKRIEFPVNSSDMLCHLWDDDELKKLNILQFYSELKKVIGYFHSKVSQFDVLMIYIPDEYDYLKDQKTIDVYFDLHDAVKLFCASMGIKVQFIEDKSINYGDKAKVKWGLSLALYAKASGSVWENTTIYEDTAFIGIGYSVRNYTYGSRFVVGCSQIFDAKGRGVKVLLQPVNTPVFIGKNPHMCKEDARRLIMGLREEYYKSNTSKLRKLVIHKNTHFSNEEIAGIMQATEGINDVELLQIQEFSCWRGLQSRRKQDNGWEIDGYPVRRGTVIQLDDCKFLMWTHGTIKHQLLAGANLNYYQGGRAIPYPLLVQRFRGKDDIETTANDLLSLTKMNWNNAGLYKTIPVTLDFSKTLSRMAKQEELIAPRSYDFRYFI